MLTLIPPPRHIANFVIASQAYCALFKLVSSRIFNLHDWSTIVAHAPLETNFVAERYFCNFWATIVGECLRHYHHYHPSVLTTV